MTRLPYFIEEVYNLKRLNSTIEYQWPDVLEELVALIERTMGYPTRLS